MCDVSRIFVGGCVILSLIPGITGVIDEFLQNQNTHPKFESKFWVGVFVCTMNDAVVLRKRNY